MDHVFVNVASYTSGALMLIVLSLYVCVYIRVRKGSDIKDVKTISLLMIISSITAILVLAT